MFCLRFCDDNVMARNLVGRAGGDLARSVQGSARACFNSSVTGGGADQMQVDIELARIMQAAETESKSLGIVSGCRCC